MNTAKMFTHSYFDNTAPEVCEASRVFADIIVVKNYVESSSRKYGQRYTQEYHDRAREGYAFTGFISLPGKQPRDVVMVKLSDEIMEHGRTTGRGDRVSSVKLCGDRYSDSGKIRVVVGFQWSDNFTSDVIPCDVMRDDLKAHLLSLASPDDAELIAWIKGGAE